MKLRRNRSETILQIQPKPSATAPIGERIAERLRLGGPIGVPWLGRQLGLRN